MGKTKYYNPREVVRVKDKIDKAIRHPKAKSLLDLSDSILNEHDLSLLLDEPEYKVQIAKALIGKRMAIEISKITEMSYPSCERFYMLSAVSRAFSKKVFEALKDSDSPYKSWNNMLRILLLQRLSYPFEPEIYKIESPFYNRQKDPAHWEMVKEEFKAAQDVSQEALELLEVLEKQIESEDKEKKEHKPVFEQNYSRPGHRSNYMSNPSKPVRPNPEEQKNIYKLEKEKEVKSIIQDLDEFSSKEGAKVKEAILEGGYDNNKRKLFSDLVKSSVKSDLPKLNKIYKVLFQTPDPSKEEQQKDMDKFVSEVVAEVRKANKDNNYKGADIKKLAEERIEEKVINNPRSMIGIDQQKLSETISKAAGDKLGKDNSLLSSLNIVRKTFHKIAGQTYVSDVDLIRKSSVPNMNGSDSGQVR